ncbi:pyridoxamine 5'-phosphate oxidase family protein [Ilyobacter polytropus]|uniref:Pyridoxamine 5'-phosphate oxidase-related FMN-binding protein n=1 Tax=Ilyobacter polytropus (strain ATCC 51220 / DSM 2926 / LMG 16218 / CuHBu1) TaxID=572544 RepID=E3HCX1_ILYPC|nr:pyridoxamine 5'-phosphate oxidase family protein [Ilyobacter polytropus]ADO84027.1 pyridoxamine 5'-phosphate oxidase-related FMN-binding protein [Ilyobacter polytropus DSM 2926]
MKSIKELKNLISKIGSKQLFAVLATSNKNQPYTSLVAFALTEDLKKLVFITPRDTRKFQYLSENNNVSLMIDNSENQKVDISKAVGITITGKSRDSSGEERENLLNLFITKHPQMNEFAFSKGCSVVSVDINRYDVVERFQNVSVLEFSKNS